jgi:lysophospholipase L1-like esterase
VTSSHGPARHQSTLTALVAALMLLGGCSSVAVPNGHPSPLPPQPGCAVAADADSVCIVVLGDSIGVGVPVEGDDRWWIRLRDALARDLPGRHVEIDNWAVSGSRVDVLQSAARDQPDLATFDIAIVIEGVNDLNDVSVEEWRPGYAAAITALEATGLIPILATPPPSFENGAFGTRYDGTASAIRELAASGSRLLFDIAARWRRDGATRAGSYYVDTVHQSAAGQALMASMARDVVLEVLKERPSG